MNGWRSVTMAVTALSALVLLPTVQAQTGPTPAPPGFAPAATYAEVMGEPPSPYAVPGAAAAAAENRPYAGGSGLEPESLPGELAEELFPTAPEEFRFGPTPVSEVGILRELFGMSDFLESRGLRTFGWLESGYTGASTGAGRLHTAPILNRYSDRYMVNQIGLVLQKPLRQDEFNIGFNIRYFAGADAATGQPKGGIGSTITDPMFSHDFRDLDLTMHLPILTEGGLDFKIGRMNTIIGYNGYLAPYRPFYSSDYQFFYLQDGAFTGFVGNLHVTDRLDIWSGMTLGANTFFVTRSANSYCYIGQINYWLTDERRTRLTASVYAGPDALFSAPGMNGTYDSMVELRVQQNWSERFTQIVQCNMGWDANTPVGTAGAYGLYTIGLFHLTPKLDFNVRGEWFQDAQGVRTGFAADYSEVTLGVNFHPTRWLEFRPEVRGDFASEPAFGGGGNPGGNYSQFTAVFSSLIKF